MHTTLKGMKSKISTLVLFIDSHLSNIPTIYSFLGILQEKKMELFLVDSCFHSYHSLELCSYQQYRSTVF